MENFSKINFKNLLLNELKYHESLFDHLKTITNNEEHNKCNVSYKLNISLCYFCLQKKIEEELISNLNYLVNLIDEI